MVGQRREGEPASVEAARVAEARQVAPHGGVSSRLLPLAARLAKRAAGFTLIELIVVLAILALLLTIAVPRYFQHVERAKEATLKQDLNIMRDSIDKFFGDKGRYPDSLEELVKERYLRTIPVDPVTESATTWLPVPPPVDVQVKGQVYDVRSGADGNALDGKPYSEM
jgi:general secretion pathway protein G